MADPIPEKFVTLPEAVERLAAKIANRDIEVTRRDLQLLYEIFGFSLAELDLARLGPNPRNEALLQWTKRELAIREIYFALLRGALRAFIRDPASGAMFRLTRDDWRRAALWDHTIRGGVIHATADEDIGRHNGHRVLVEEAAFSVWVTKERKRKPAGGFRDLCALLEKEMHDSPSRRLRPKAEWQRIAKAYSAYPGANFWRRGDPRLRRPARIGASPAHLVNHPNNPYQYSFRG
jgi:hypothetical protein